jgi:ribosomal protein S18 acetylase RimI-like enzyme
MAPWAVGRTIEQTREMLKHTDLAISAWDGDRLVGFGRVLTDYVFRASIWDVIVDPDHQGQDIGTELMQHILHHPALSRVELFWLCTRDKQAFYEKLGFSANEQTGMVWARSKHVRNE